MIITMHAMQGFIKMIFIKSLLQVCNGKLMKFLERFPSIVDTYDN